MSVYVEIMCNKAGEFYEANGRLICWTHSNDNPQGGSIPDARANAKEQGWKRDVCPACQKFAASATEEAK